jgi:hypothetical protein
MGRRHRHGCDGATTLRARERWRGAKAWCVIGPGVFRDLVPAPDIGGLSGPAHRSYTGFMSYGHGSWIALVVFGGMFAIRYLSSQRRPNGRGGAGAAGPRNSLTSSDRRGPSAPPNGGSGSGTTESGTAPGWFADPFCKHEQRYWSGTEWTAHVTDDGVPGTDPPPHGTG